MKELNFLKYATIVFMLFIFFWVSFGGYILGTQGNNEVETEQQINKKIEDSGLKAEMKDAEILGKFYNEKGYFIVVYNGTTKAPEVFQVDFSEWELMEVGVSFVTVGVGSKEETKTVQRESLGFQESKLRAKLEDATILGKFWNSKGHFIVVYNGTTKAPELFEVDFSEWELMDVGERY